MKISQAAHFAGSFGEILRSSAIFYYRQSENVRTTISFMNYWPLKRGIEVAVLASLRRQDGSLIGRERIDFSGRTVVNYSPKAPDADFTGSVEIEVFALKNLVIPYSAIMAVYETPRGVSMVHSYSRVYAPHEIEEGRTITEGEESCWTIRDDEDVVSFGVFHNGMHASPAQNVKLRVTADDGESAEETVSLPSLRPYETVVIEPGRHIAGLTRLLKGRPGNCSVSFQVEDAFTRMLVGNRRRDDSDLQVTHSNFNYSRHQTDHVPSDKPLAYMAIPPLRDILTEIVVYPDSDRGDYQVDLPSGRSRSFHTGHIETIPIAEAGAKVIFRRKDGLLPSRIVTALRAAAPAQRIPAECSLGVAHQLRPAKRFWWSLCAARDRYRSEITVADLREVYGGCSPKQPLTIRLYSAHSTEHREVIVTPERLEEPLSIDELFPDAEAFLGGDFGYFTLFSEYGGFWTFSTLRKGDTSVTFEHAF
jgi:hypothetical protein